MVKRTPVYRKRKDIQKYRPFTDIPKCPTLMDFARSRPRPSVKNGMKMFRFRATQEKQQLRIESLKLKSTRNNNDNHNSGVTVKSPLLNCCLQELQNVHAFNNNLISKMESMNEQHANILGEWKGKFVLLQSKLVSAENQNNSSKFNSRLQKAQNFQQRRYDRLLKHFLLVLDEKRTLEEELENDLSLDFTNSNTLNCPNFESLFDDSSSDKSSDAEIIPPPKLSEIIPPPKDSESKNLLSQEFKIDASFTFPREPLPVKKLSSSYLNGMENKLFRKCYKNDRPIVPAPKKLSQRFLDTMDDKLFKPVVSKQRVEIVNKFTPEYLQQMEGMLFKCFSKNKNTCVAKRISSDYLNKMDAVIFGMIPCETFDKPVSSLKEKYANVFAMLEELYDPESDDEFEEKEVDGFVLVENSNNTNSERDNAYEIESVY